MPSVTYTAVGLHYWNVPPKVTSLTVECWGAGGCGSHGISIYDIGGGGGGGGCYVYSVITVSPGGQATIFVGAGASDVSGSSSPMASGQYSYFAFQGITRVKAYGGESAHGVDFGPGGSLANGTIRRSGGNGADGSFVSYGYSYPWPSGGGGGGGGDAATGGDASGPTGGTGGNSGGANVGANGINAWIASNGYPGTAPGGGGSGAHSLVVPQVEVGGSGANGQVRITWTDSGTLFAPMFVR